MIARVLYAIALITISLRVPVTYALEPLPPEQESDFYKSAHGFMDCKDCHFSDQSDSIPRSRIPLLCADCHSKPFDDYILSIHWKEKNPEAVCVDCHGVHNILMVKNSESIAYRSLVCGGCHIGSKENFDRGPHKEGMENSQALACASCHGNHKVQRPTISNMEENCTQCHSEASPEFEMGQRVKVQLAGIRDTLALVQVEIKGALGLGLNTRRPEQSFQESNSNLSQAILVWHSLSEKEINEQVARTSEASRRARDQTADLLNSRINRRLGLAAAWAVILINILFLYLKHRKLESS